MTYLDYAGLSALDLITVTDFGIEKLTDDQVLHLLMLADHDAGYPDEVPADRASVAHWQEAARQEFEIRFAGYEQDRLLEYAMAHRASADDMIQAAASGELLKVMRPW